jgi:hypothetical protein
MTPTKADPRSRRWHSRPDFSGIKAPVEMTDPEIIGQAVHIGKHQPEREGAAIQAVWVRGA